MEIRITELYFSLMCESGGSLDGFALPRFECARSVEKVTVLGCAPPRGGYAALLAEVGVAAKSALTLTELPAARLTRAHLAGLPPLRALHVRRARGQPARLRADADFLAPVNASLRELHLLGVALAPAALRALPEGLELLDVSDAALDCADGCAAALARLPRLRSLSLGDGRLHEAPALAAAPALRVAYVIAPLRRPLLSRRVAVENATFV